MEAIHEPSGFILYDQPLLDNPSQKASEHDLLDLFFGKDYRNYAAFCETKREIAVDELDTEIGENIIEDYDEILHAWIFKDFFYMVEFNRKEKRYLIFNWDEQYSNDYEEVCKELFIAYYRRLQ